MLGWGWLGPERGLGPAVTGLPSWQFELAVDAVHRKTSEQTAGPRREDIVDTMVFKPADVMLVRFRNIDFNYATKGSGLP